MQTRLRALNIDALKKKASMKTKNNSGNITNPIRRARRILKILEYYNFKCAKCDSLKKLTIDHKNGRAFAKHDDATKYKLDKCQVLCVKCHLEKNNGVKNANI